MGPLLHRNALLTDQCQRRFHTVTVRLVVGTVQERDLARAVFFCHRLVRHQHEILNHTCCHIGRIRADLHRRTLCIENHLALRELKVDCTALFSAVSDQRRELFHILEHRNEFAVFLHQLRVRFRLGQDRIDCGIRHAPVNADHSLSNLMADHTAFSVDCHNAGQRQTLFSLIQGTDSV